MGNRIIRDITRDRIEAPVCHQAAIQHIQTEDDDIMHNLEELLASHPMMAKRVEQIRRFTSSQDYRQMQAMMDKNLVA